jgi:hypothetical protein
MIDLVTITAQNAARRRNRHLLSLQRGLSRRTQMLVTDNAPDVIDELVQEVERLHARLWEVVRCEE